MDYDEFEEDFEEDVENKASPAESHGRDRGANVQRGSDHRGVPNTSTSKYIVSREGNISPLAIHSFMLCCLPMLEDTKAIAVVLSFPLYGERQRTSRNGEVHLTIKSSDKIVAELKN